MNSSSYTNPRLPQQEVKIQEVETEPREQWTNHIEFILTVVGFAVGVGNLWRFPYLVYEYGGGAFLIPYWLSVFIIGIPMFALELGVGQRFRHGPIRIWEKLDPRFVGVGISTMFESALVGLYYNILLVWSTFYFFNSFQDPLPWEDGDDEEASQNYFWDNIQKTDNVNDLGSVSWQLGLCHTFCWIILYFSLFKGIKSTGKIVYFTALFPYVVLVILFFKGVTLDGAADGIDYYLSPDWSQLWNFKTWMVAAQQIFFSLSVCFGTHIAYGSFNPRTTNFIRDTWLVVLINCFTSFFGGFVVFSCLGFMAHERGVDVEDVVDSGTALAFVAYPEILAQMPASPFFSTMFFLMMFCLGIDSEFGMLEGLITSMLDSKYRPQWMDKKIATGIVCIVGWLFGFLFVTDGGYYLVNMFNYFVPLIGLFFVGLVECYAICWIYGVEKFFNDINLMTGFYLGNGWKFLYMYILPFIFTILVIVSFISLGSDFKDLFCKSYDDEESDDVEYFDCDNLDAATTFGVILSIIPIIPIPLYLYLNRKQQRVVIEPLTLNDL